MGDAHNAHHLPVLYENPPLDASNSEEHAKALPQHFEDTTS